ncbi:hypothetical protein RclHR1_05990003 [Rhizophagus clarus]|uniref:Kinase-like domain-containing protein n=1 Tax=Rhizophagus clarus TaxID=94130 RepID=A0A2Z6RQP2_9GLOM|nr:hypothetical protein RclHR1_05990003 [Rhizophagus clarus]GES81652.1 kinase-like domain-containing protein [Rhizophagus clarus]
MELVKIIDENSFDPTPKLKSSPIPIEFISFNENDDKCIYCKEAYVDTPTCITTQKYCKKCLSRYLSTITDNNIYLDVYYTMKSECIKHEIEAKEPHVIQECCRNCLDILCLKQIPANDNLLRSSSIYAVIENSLYDNMIESEKYCKLCGKSLYQGTDTLEMSKFKLCSDCYQISSGYIGSILTKISILIIYLPWWHNRSSCNVCNTSLTFTSDCQKYCENCLISYIGCRYCLTTNIIFGLTIQSQCKKCKRTSSIIFDITSILSGNSELDEFLLNLNPGIYNNLRIDELSDKIKNNDKYFIPSEIISTIRSMCQNYKNTQSKILMDQSERSIEWIPYSQFTNVVEIIKGEVCIIYHAIWDQQSVILKKFKNFQDTGKYFLNELKSNCYEIKHHNIRIHGVTKDDKLGDYMLVTQYASGGVSYDWLKSELYNCLQYNERDLVKLMFFDPTPKLKSSSIPIKFISFNEDDNKCIYCEEEYTKTLFSISQRCQRYCKNCLSNYLTNINDINIYLDLHVFTQNGEHETIKTKESQDIQECSKCLDILCFKQIPVDDCYLSNSSVIEFSLYNNIIENEKFCKLCGESLFLGADIIEIRLFVLCSNCYLISTGHINSSLTKKPIPVIYLPWWHNISCCVACNKSLIFTSDCQKYCENCFIFYIGCRYCLTTNIIFGSTTQSQCMKCERISSIIFDNTSILSENSELNDFILKLNPEIYNNLRINELPDKIKNNDKYFLLLEINSTIQSICQNYKNTQSKDQSEKLMEWIPYSQFTNVVEIAEGGFGIIYRAIRGQQSVILKKFKNFQYASKYFLNELKSNQTCFEIKHHIIRTHGITKDPKSGDYMLVMQFASGGDLHNWLQKKFTEIKWNKDKLIILWQISEGLETIHNANYIHRDFHSGNILHDLFRNNAQERFKERHQWLIGDLGLSQHVNNASNNEIYGVIPYIAPEIFRGFSFSKKSDVYSMGMIMWELTTGCKPFADVEHDINLIFKILDGERPEITEDTPECYADLMKSCWDPNPKKRPTAKKIRTTFGSWSFRYKNNDIFNKAELIRKELLKLKKLGPEFAKNTHPKAIYTGRSLSSIISKYSSVNSSSSISLYINKQDYNYISNEQEFDIDINSKFINSLAVTSKKRSIEESNIEIHDNIGKYVKTSRFQLSKDTMNGGGYAV